MAFSLQTFWETACSHNCLWTPSARVCMCGRRLVCPGRRGEVTGIGGAAGRLGRSSRRRACALRSFCAFLLFNDWCITSRFANSENWGKRGLLWGGRPCVCTVRLPVGMLSVSDFFGLHPPLCEGGPPDRGPETGRGCGCPRGRSQHFQTLGVCCLGGKPHLKPGRITPVSKTFLNHVRQKSPR